jgi:hypothetical protein
MTAPARLSTAQFQRNVFLFGIINCLVYAAILVVFRLIHSRILPSLLVLIDCVVLWIISHIQIKRLAKTYTESLKFLRSFSLVFFTGALGFLLFGGFILLYSLLDKGLAALLTNAGEQLLTPVIVIVSEGGGRSVVVALICMMYADQFYDHEKKP